VPKVTKTRRPRCDFSESQNLESQLDDTPRRIVSGSVPGSRPASTLAGEDCPSLISEKATWGQRGSRRSAKRVRVRLEARCIQTVQGSDPRLPRTPALAKHAETIADRFIGDHTSRVGIFEIGVAIGPITCCLAETLQRIGNASSSVDISVGRFTPRCSGTYSAPGASIFCSGLTPR
jgi:hypothetical protein